MHTPNLETSMPSEVIVSHSSDFTMPQSFDSVNLRLSKQEAFPADMNSSVGLGFFYGGATNVQGSFYSFDYSGGIGLHGRDHIRPAIQIQQFSPLVEEDETLSSSPANKSGSEYMHQALANKRLSAPEPIKRTRRNSGEAPVSIERKGFTKRVTSHPNLSYLIDNEAHSFTEAPKPMKRVGSSPNLGLLERSLSVATVRGQESGEVFTGYRKQRSVPASPQISPKLLRKNVQAQSNPPDIPMPENRHLLLTNLTGAFRKLKKHQTKVEECHQHDSEVTVRRDGHVVPSLQQPSAPATTEAVLLSTSPQPTKEAKSLMSSIITWATTSKVEPSMKEMNIYSPQTL